MRTPTNEKTIGTTGMFTVGCVQGGRQNGKTFLVYCGGRVVGGGAQGGKDAAIRLAGRCDRLVAMWHGCAK